MTVLGIRPISRPALIDGETGDEVTFRAVLEQGAAIVSRLETRRQLLFLLARNDLFTAVTYAGALEAGHVVALLDATAPAAITGGVIAAYRPSWLAGPAGSGAALEAAGTPVDAVFSVPGGELARMAFQPAETGVALHPDLALLLTTSGTTGSRKLVRLSATNIRANASSIAAYLGLTEAERPVTSLPLHYSFGLSVLNSHWRAGAAPVLTGHSVAQQPFWTVVEKRGCTSLAGVPFTFQMLERTGFRQRELPNLRTLQQAGGALDTGLARTYAQHMLARGGRLFVMYGQTEATARIAFVPPDRLLTKLGSAGVAVPGGRIHVDVADGSDVVPSSSLAAGEIVYEGPNVMLGYASGHEDLALGDELGGVLRTGDIGYLDDDGYVFLVGRSKRIAKLHGLRINLDEVETVLRDHGPVAIVGRDDALWAFCEFGTDASLTAVGNELAGRFRLHHSTVRMVRVDAIPTTASGKIDYGLIQRWIPD